MTVLTAEAPAFLAGGGDLGVLIRAHDWAATPLGRPERWPGPLKTLAAVMLASNQAMFIAWGPERTLLYNDRYAEILADKHPLALGRPFLEVWSEIAGDLLPIVDQAYAGRPVQMDRIELVMQRRGYPEETHFSFSYTPVRDEEGRVAGFFCPCQEITAEVRFERRSRFFDTLGELLREADAPERVAAVASELLGERLGAGAVGYAEAEADGEHVVVQRDWVGPGGTSVVGRHRLRDYGEGIAAELLAGRTVVVDDVGADPLTQDGDGFELIGCRALVNMPVMVGGRLAALLFVLSPEPRRWTDADLQLVAQVAERTRAAVERGRAEAALRESEDHYRHAIELDPQTNWTARPDGQLDLVNHRWFEWTGTTGLGSSYADGLHDDDRQRTFDVWGRSVATGEPYDIEHRVKMRDGSYRWMHSRAFPRRDEAGRIVKWYGTTEDVDGRYRAERRQRFLLTLSDRMRGLGDPAAIVAVAAETLGRELGAARAGFGEIDAGETAVSVIRDWSADPNAPSLVGPARPLSRLGAPLLAELRAARTVCVNDCETDERVGPDVLPIWREAGIRALLHVPLVRDGSLRAKTFVHADAPRDWSLADVELAEAVAERTWEAVERVKAEQALREETRTLEMLNRVGAALAGELDLERLVQMVTDAGVALTGAQFGAFFHNILDDSGERLYLFTLSGADRADFEKLGRVRATGVFGPTFRNEGVVRSDDILADERYGRFEPHRGMPKGHLPVRSYMGVPVVSRGGAVLGGLLFGHPEPGRFTERHERLMLGVAAQAAVAIDNARLFAEVENARQTLETRVAERTLELEQANEALRQSQKMEAVGRLTGGIAHDFNNMLAVVVGSLDLLGRRLPGHDPRSRRYLDAAADGARRAAQLTQRLLAFSRQTPLRPEPLDVNALVAGMSDLLRHSLGPDVQLEVDLQPGLWRTHADPNQLENAILNLAVNARDAMPGGGRLTIATANRAHGDECVSVSVADTGTGMTPEVIAKVFDPFFTTKEVGKGTGLGLSQVHGFVNQSGGRVDIRSAPGEGTTIEILLPRYLGAAQAAGEAADAPEPPAAHAREVVLVVEDEPAVRQFSTDALSELGYRVLEADGAAAALRLLDAHPEVSLLFTDVVMPEVNGAKLAEEARRRRPDLRVLYTTGYARDAISQGGVLSPGVELIGKPFTVEELAAKVRHVLDAPVA